MSVSSAKSLVINLTVPRVNERHSVSGSLPSVSLREVSGSRCFLSTDRQRYERRSARHCEVVASWELTVAADTELIDFA